MARFTTHTEDRLALELADDAEQALEDGRGTLESARREGGRYVKHDEPLADAVYAATGEDDCREVVVAALIEAAKTNGALRWALAQQIGKSNAMGVMHVRGWIDLGEVA